MRKASEKRYEPGADWAQPSYPEWYTKEKETPWTDADGWEHRADGSLWRYVGEGVYAVRNEAKPKVKQPWWLRLLNFIFGRR